jgi:hypothetical protein
LPGIAVKTIDHYLVNPEIRNIKGFVVCRQVGSVHVGLFLPFSIRSLSLVADSLVIVIQSPASTSQGFK